MKNKNRNSGFTLIELLLTVTIVGVLASIALPFYDDYRRRANDTIAISQIRNMVTALNALDEEEEEKNAFHGFSISTSGRILGSASILPPGFVHNPGVQLTIQGRAIVGSHCRGSKSSEAYSGANSKTQLWSYGLFGSRGSIVRINSTFFTRLNSDGSDCP